jgi:hypothetical protein
VVFTGRNEKDHGSREKEGRGKQVAKITEAERGTDTLDLPQVSYERQRRAFASRPHIHRVKGGGGRMVCERCLLAKPHQHQPALK